MKLEDITANGMRKIATQENSKQLKEILLKIKEAAHDSELFIYLPNFYIKTSTRLELESRGFIVEIGGRYNDVDVSISW